MAKSKITDEEVRIAVSESFSIRQVLNKLGLKEAGGNYKTINGRMSGMGLDPLKVFGDIKKRQGYLKYRKRAKLPKKPLAEILVDNSHTGTSNLRKRLINEGMLEERCSSCRLDEWMGTKIPLELDHINGVNTDNRLENLRILCPNCHALTDTYRGRNIGKTHGRVVECIHDDLKNRCSKEIGGSSPP
jgi:hypothetical protein